MNEEYFFLTRTVGDSVTKYTSDGWVDLGHDSKPCLWHSAETAALLGMRMDVKGGTLILVNKVTVELFDDGHLVAPATDDFTRDIDWLNADSVHSKVGT